MRAKFPYYRHLNDCSIYSDCCNGRGTNKESPKTSSGLAPKAEPRKRPDYSPHCVMWYMGATFLVRGPECVLVIPWVKSGQCFLVVLAVYRNPSAYASGYSARPDNVFVGATFGTSGVGDLF